MQRQNTSARRAARANTPPQVHRPRVINLVQLGNITAKIMRRNTSARFARRVNTSPRQRQIRARRVKQADTKAKLKRQNTSARRAARANTPPQAHRPHVINLVQLGNIRAKMKRRSTNARCVSRERLAQTLAQNVKNALLVSIRTWLSHSTTHVLTALPAQNSSTLNLYASTAKQENTKCMRLPKQAPHA